MAEFNILVMSQRFAMAQTLTTKVVGSSPIGQGGQAMAYVPNAVPEGNGTQELQPLGTAGNATHLYLVPLLHGKAMNVTTAPTSVALFDQGLVDVLQAAVTGLQPNHPYVLALSRADGSGPLVHPLVQFKTRPAGSAVVNTIGQIRQILQEGIPPRYLVIVPGTAPEHGPPGDYAEDTAMEMLTTTISLPDDPSLTWDQREEQWKLSGKIYRTHNFTQSAGGHKDG
jgi:hypothetical protein